MGSLKPCSLVALKPFCYWTPLVFSCRAHLAKELSMVAAIKGQNVLGCRRKLQRHNLHWQDFWSIPLPIPCLWDFPFALGLVGSDFSLDLVVLFVW